MGRSSSGKYRKLVKDGKEYLFTRYELLRLELLEKISSIVALIILVMITLALLISVWVYISGILIVWMESYFGSFIPPFIVMGSINLLLLAIIISLKEWLILNPLIRVFSRIIFDHTKEDVDDEDGNDENKKKDEEEIA
jgi:hypothetical protein